MPIITIIDEQRAALEKVEALSELGLASPDAAVYALALIAAVVANTRNAVVAVVRDLK